MNVLIVEDNEDSRNLLVKQLRAYGHKVTAAVDGVDALEKALKDTPDILVSDILMPRMDGYQLCYEWKQDKRLKGIPFVFCTAIYTSGEDEKFALSLGANLFIRKPIEPEALAKILSRAFEQAGEGLLPAAEATLKPSLYLTEYNKRLVVKLNDKVAELKTSEEELRYLSSVLEAIRNINQLIVRERDRTKLLKVACRILHKVREYRFVWMGLIEEGHKRVIPVARAGVEDGYLDSVKISWDDRPSGRGPTGTAIKTRKPDVIKNIPKNPRAVTWREEALKRGYRSSAAIPLIHDDRVYGALNVYSSHPDGFNGAEIGLLTEVSGDIAFALKAIERQEARQQVEEELRESNKRFIDIAENALEWIWEVDDRGKYTYASPVVKQILGYKPEEIVGKHFYDVFHPDDREELKKAASAVFASKQPFRQFSNRNIHKNGEIVWLLTSAVPILDEGGNLLGYRGADVDITERKKAEEALRESEAFQSGLLANSPIPINVINADSSVRYVNPAMVKLTGFSAEELTGEKAPYSYWPKEDVTKIMKGFKKAMRYGGDRMLELFKRKNGEKFWVEITTTPVRKDGKFQYLLANWVDITERKRAEESLRESEARYRAVIEGAHDMIQSIGLDGRIIFVNKSWLDTLGYTEAELSSLNFFEIVHPDSQAHCREMLAEVASGKPVQGMETTFLTKDGRKILVEGNAAPRYIGSKVVATQGVFRDVTERKQAEEALRESEAFQSGLLANSPIPINVINADSSVRYVNPAMVKLTGFSAEELTGEKAPYSYWPKEDVTKIMKGFKKAMRYGGDRMLELFKRKNGEKFWVEITTTPVRKDGKFQYLLANWVDITERKRAEEALIDEATRRRILIDESSDGIVILDEKGKVYEANLRFAEMLGYSPEEVRELHAWDWDARLKREQIAEMVASIGPEGTHFETQHRRKDGTIFDVELSNNGAVYAGQKLIFCVSRDVTERKKAEAALKESEEKYKTLVEATSDVIWETDEEGVFTFISPRIKDILGYEVDEIVGKKRTLDLIAKGEMRKWLKRFKEVSARRAPFFGFEIPHVHKDGSQLICETSGIPLFDSAGKFKGYVGIDKDITERRNMQEQLVITDRLASVGELAAGIAHELNNPLTGVIGFSQLLMDKEMPKDIKEDVEVVYSEAQRASQVVKHLLTFARKHAAVKEKVNVNDIIGKVLELRAYEQNLENIKVDDRLYPELPEVMADYFQLQQVFLNIVINAEYFMKETNHRGNLTITTEKVGNKVKASFADDGPGIAKDALGHLFDPFFTTKEVGKGTGLGLSICHGIIAEHGGRIYVESEVGKGATFIVELPIGAAEKKGGAA